MRINQLERWIAHEIRNDVRMAMVRPKSFLG